MDLIAGANTIVPTTALTLEIQVFGIDSTALDFSAYSLAAQTNKVRGDDDMIFYGLLNNQNHSIYLEQKSIISFHLQLHKIDAQIHRIAICATLANEQLNFSNISHLLLKVKNQQQTLAQAKIIGQNHREVALILGEFYRYKELWKFKMIAQGFNGGLKPLAEHFGVEIADEQPTHIDPTPPAHVELPNTLSEQATTSHILKDIFSAPLKALEKRKHIKEFQKQLLQIFATHDINPQNQQQLIEFCTDKNITLADALNYSEQEIKSFLLQVSQHKSKQQIIEWAQFLQVPQNTLEQALIMLRQANEVKFVNMLKTALADGILSNQEIEKLTQFATLHQLNSKELVQRAKNAIEDFFNFTLASLIFDGTISHENELLIKKLCQFLHPEPTLLKQINRTISIAKQITQIKQGQVNTIQTTEIIVKNSEFVYLHQKKVGIQATKKEYVVGDLFITSERIIFKASTAFELLISNIIAVEILSEYIEIIAKTKKGSGKYHIGKDSNIVEAYIEYAIKRFHRQLDFSQSSGNTRHIPQNIKNAVWQKCQGKCVQCSSSAYLEFDHIIPFSKGGSNSENNLQILCRKCNLEKSNQI